MILGIFYKKSRVKTGKPIVVSNGNSKIFTNNVHIEGHVVADVVFNSAKEKFPSAARFGTTTPLLIQIQDGEEDFGPLDTAVVPADMEKKYQKALKERQRYRKNHLIIRRPRKID